VSVAGDSDKLFVGSIPEVYESHLVPLIFESYAIDMVMRLEEFLLSDVLELAAGTGVVTRHLARGLPDHVGIVATDLNQPMLDVAAARGVSRAVRWYQADAMRLPFPDASFDAVVCQFGVMFFPDKVRAFAEARRVLRPGGVFLFNVWDRIEENEFALTITDALGNMFPDNPPQFMARVPHGYHDTAVIAQNLRDAGFPRRQSIETIAVRSRAESARIPAVAYCQGTPLRSEIEARDPARLSEATDVAEAAIARRFGSELLSGKIQAHVITNMVD
jgi:ubiquinone/menaquinone biosynthesis C-methylase UbiE